MEGNLKVKGGNKTLPYLPYFSRKGNLSLTIYILERCSKMKGLWYLNQPCLSCFHAEIEQL